MNFLVQPLLNGNLAKKIDDWEEEEKEEEKKDDLLTCVASPQVKMTFRHSHIDKHE